MLVTLIIFILILGLLIFVHELGHFWVAKKCGVKVKEFAFGFKPRLFSWKRGETEYAINAIPLGGYVHLEGEGEEPGSGDHKPGSFAGKPPLPRALILVAGVVMNLLLAWVLLTITYIMGSYALTPTFSDHAGLERTTEVVVVDVQPGSPALGAGLQPGDIIQRINDRPVSDAEDLASLTEEFAGQEVALTYERNNESKQVHVTPRPNPPEGQGSLGISMGEASTARAPWYKAPFIAAAEVASQVRLAVVGFFQFIETLFTEQRVSEDVSGIVGVGAATGIVRRLGLAPLMQFTAFISTNLAVINLMPILPLDGGHLLFTAIEAIRRKPVTEKIRYWVTLTGLLLIGLLFVSVTYKDFIRFAILDRIRELFS